MFHVAWNLILVWALAAFFTLGAVINVLALGTTADEYQRWGYPDWFHFVTGALELATAILLAVTATRWLGAGLGGAVMVAAAATVIAHGEYVRAAPPVVVLVLLSIVGWTAR
jgi:DoxX-like family